MAEATTLPLPPSAGATTLTSQMGGSASVHARVNMYVYIYIYIYIYNYY